MGRLLARNRRAVLFAATAQIEASLGGDRGPDLAQGLLDLPKHHGWSGHRLRRVMLDQHHQDTLLEGALHPQRRLAIAPSEQCSLEVLPKLLEVT